MLMWTLIFVGLGSVYSIPKESAPDVIVPVGIVSIVLRGGSAEDVEKLITNKIEQEVINVSNIDKVTSTSRDGVSIISAQFLASADVDKSISDLKSAVDKVKGDLPADANEPSVAKVSFSDQPVIIISVSQDLPSPQMTQLGLDLERELKKVKGVSSVDISGTRKREVQVVVQKDKLAKYGLSVGQVTAALQQANASVPVGKITVGGIDYPIKFTGSIDEASVVQDISLLTSAGTLVYIRDIAFVSDGLAKPSTFSRVSVAGAPSDNALTLSVHKKSGGDVTLVTSGVKAKIEELKSTMLIGAQVVTSIDAGAVVKHDIGELTKTGLETVVLVMIVLLLTIGWRESIVAGLSIPLSFVIAFIGLYVSGNTINFLSLFSLILGIGILVDSGIVVAEAIHTKMKKTGDIQQSAMDSIREYAWPLIAGTFTTIAVFFPLFFLSGIVGQFIKSIPFTLIFVLLASIFVALGMVPILATVLTKNSDHKNKFVELQEEYFVKAQTWYKSFLKSILINRKTQNRFILSLIAAFVLSICLVVFGVVKVELFPQDDQTFAIISIEGTEGTTLAQTDITVRAVEEILYNQPLVKSFVTTVGESSGLVDNNGGSRNTKNANITVILGEKETRNVTSSQIVEILRSSISHINDGSIKVGQANNGPPSGKPVTIKFVGDDLDQLSLAADKAEEILGSISGAQDVETSLRNDGTQLEINIDRAKATASGLSSAGLAGILRSAVSGVTATTIKKQGSDIDIMVKVDLNSTFINPEDTTVTTLDSIKNLPISTPAGSILLGSLISTSISESRSSISHEGQKRIVSVSSDLSGAATAIQVTDAFQKREGELKLPSTIQIKYGGDTEDIQNTFRDMLIALVAGMLLMLGILVLTFNSIRYSVYLLSNIVHL